jgi:organic radical activating enzyme
MCHRTGGFKLLDVPSNNFSDFNKHPKLIEERSQMIAGQWPTESCSYCRTIEEAGGISERIGNNKVISIIPQEFYQNYESPPLTATPKILEVYFNNLCNLKCAYCSPVFSSKISQEIKQHGPLSQRYNLDKPWPHNPNYQKRKEQFWEWMKANSTELEIFQTLGGEPMYQPEFQECLEFFEKHNNPKLKWQLFSNLAHTQDNFKHNIQKLETLVANGKIKQCSVVCSIDCWGDEQEFSRFGIDMDNWAKNFELLIKSKYIDVSVHSTLTPITLPTAWKLTEFLNSKSTEHNKHINQSWNIISDPAFLDPSVFGNYLDGYFTKLIQTVRNPPDYLTGFYTKVSKSAVNRVLMYEFVDYMDKLDLRRNTNWRNVYPELSNIVTTELGDTQ